MIPTLLPIGQAALFLHGRVAYELEFRGMGTHSPEDASACVDAAIAEAPIVMMAGHGVVVTGPSVAEALYDLYLLETAARMQLLSMGSGAPLRTIGKDTIDLAVEEINVLRPRQAERYFVAAKRALNGIRR
ncbi:class II aldolase/adducin family protein [Amycolatopsis sp. cg5]|uniref:class II aldolase/adducin family protein n=1 Tax=Amycolatopsis sp. cg5 TaxID=3238802 RepID=UPI0035265AD8